MSFVSARPPKLECGVPQLSRTPLGPRRHLAGWDGVQRGSSLIGLILGAQAARPPAASHAALPPRAGAPSEGALLWRWWMRRRKRW